MNTERKILLNLALRYRSARKLRRRFLEEGKPAHLVQHYFGAENEAWNSFQAAKQIYLSGQK